MMSRRTEYYRAYRVQEMHHPAPVSLGGARVPAMDVGRGDQASGTAARRARQGRRASEQRGYGVMGPLEELEWVLGFAFVIKRLKIASHEDGVTVSSSPHHGEPAQAISIWTEHRNPEGRAYWFNTGTKVSVWEKPDVLKTPFERALNQTKWKEYFSGGRKYYYNTETKGSKWDMPDELLLVLEKVERETPETPARPAAPGFTPVGPGALVAVGADLSAIAANGAAAAPENPLAVGMHTGGAPFPTPPGVLPSHSNLPEDPMIPHNGFATLEEGERAFTHLLRKAGVDPTWPWGKTMRAIITDPLYKALSTLAEKVCFQKYTTHLKAKELEDKEARFAKLRPALRNMLKGNPNVFHYTTFSTAHKLFAAHPIWQQTRIESEHRLIFDEYLSELKNREVQETRAARAGSISTVVAMFKELNVDVDARETSPQVRVGPSERKGPFRCLASTTWPMIWSKSLLVVAF
ncbi:hypothetical protein C8J57DRAFT_1732256 [Mycena rebaudengoi]|nr:hypothetical protein C8J57DRAFT_1732256 [Mycena rebaudengoi]